LSHYKEENEYGNTAPADQVIYSPSSTRFGSSPPSDYADQRRPGRKLTLISAPAGFGKTTLLGEWIPTSRRPVTWLSLEEADNDPIRFWTYFMAALQMLREDLARDAQVFLNAEGQQRNLAQLESFLTILLNDISFFSEEFALVLDDYQHISILNIYEGILFLIDHLPPNMHILITCRADPHLPLARLRHGTR
jgi:LuxR family maltose regulon positive regulatory protein